MRAAVVLVAVGVLAVFLVGVLRSALGPGVAPESTASGGQGTVLPLPAAGTVAAEFLPDDTPVFVVHSRGGDVVVVDARAPHAVGVQILVGWCVTAGWFEEGPFASRFLPDGRWLAGPAPSDLATFHAEVDDDTVRVGARRAASGRGDGEHPGQPGPSCESAPPWVAKTSHRDGALLMRGTLLMHHAEDEPLTVAEAARQTPGSVVLVTGHLEQVGLADPVLCTPAAQPPYCGKGGVPVDNGSSAFVDDADYASGFAGRFLVRVTEDGLQVLTLLPDGSFYARAFRGHWELTGPSPSPATPPSTGRSATRRHGRGCSCTTMSRATRSGPSSRPQTMSKSSGVESLPAAVRPHRSRRPSCARGQPSNRGQGRPHR